ncbi:MAG: ribbon-helix-helix protein, CopG family [Myxococcota bacterium]
MNSKKRVGEPVQVYLDPAERRRLERLAARLGATKSDVLRRALEALERQTADPEAHPALQIIALVERARSGGPGYDVAREHDRYLAETEAAASRRRAKRPGRRGR